jgi:hypothetical protein
MAVADELLPQITSAIDTLHRHHLQAIGRRYSDVGADVGLNVVQLWSIRRPRRLHGFSIGSSVDFPRCCPASRRQPAT